VFQEYPDAPANPGYKAWKYTAFQTVRADLNIANGPQFVSDSVNSSWLDESVEDATDGVLIAINNNYDEGNLGVVTTTAPNGMSVSVLQPRRDNEPDRFATRVHRVGGGGNGSIGGYSDPQVRPAILNLSSTFEFPPNFVRDYPNWVLSNGQHPTSNLIAATDALYGTVSFDIPTGVKLWIPANFAYPGQLTHAFYVDGFRYVEVKPDQPYSVDGTKSVPLLVEGMSASSGTIGVTYTPDRPTTSWSDMEDDFKERVIELDADVDSDNNNGTGAPDRSQAEDDIELSPRLPGKIVPVNSVDKDHDSVPDFVDGFNLDGSLTVADDAVTSGAAGFAQLVVEIPAGVDLSQAELAFSYSASDPAQAQIDAYGRRTPASGGLRIWTADEGTQRKPGRANDTNSLTRGNFVAPTSSIVYQWGAYYRGGSQSNGFSFHYGDPSSTANYASYVHLLDGSNVYKPSDLGSGRTLTLYIEGVTAGKYSINVLLDPDGHTRTETVNGQSVVLGNKFLGFVPSDSVNVTVASTVGVSAIDKYGQEGTNDNIAFAFSRAGAETSALPVYFRVTTAGTNNALDPAADPANGDFNSSVALDPYTGIGMINIPAGQVSAVLTLTPKDDDRVEWDEKFDIELLTYEQYFGFHTLPGTATSLGGGGVTPNDGVPENTAGYLGNWWSNNGQFYGYGVADHRYSLADDPTLQRAEAFVLDNDAIDATSTRNVDAASTGESPDGGANAGVSVDYNDGSVTLALPLGGDLPYYHGNHNLHPLVTVTMEFPWVDYPSASSLTGRVVFAGIPGAVGNFDLSGLTPYLAANPGRPVKITVLGPDYLNQYLPTGNYDYSITVTGDVGGVPGQRTARGTTEIVNRTSQGGGWGEFGDNWSLDGLDRLVPGDGIAPRGDISLIGAGLHPEATSNLAAEGARTENGMAVIRGDDTSAWYKTSIDTSFGSSSARVLSAGDAASPYGYVTYSGSFGQTTLANPKYAWLPVGGLGQGPAHNLISAGGLAGAINAISWTFTNLPANHQFQVFVSYLPGADRASRAPYTITGAQPVGGGLTNKTVFVDQQFIPGETVTASYGDLIYGGQAQFRSLGFFVSVGSSGQITVTLSTQLADGFVDGFLSANAVMLVDDWAFATPDGSFNRLDQGSLASNGYWAEPGFTPQAGYFTLRDKNGTRQEFDPQGLLKTEEDRLGNRVQYAYVDANDDGLADELGYRTTQGGLTTTYAYEDGVLDSVTDFAGRVTTFAIAGHQVAGITLPDPDPNDNNYAPEYAFGYLAGLLSSATDANGHTSGVNYDDFYRAKSVTNADGNVWYVSPFTTDGAASSSSVGIPLRPSSGDVANTRQLSVREGRARYGAPQDASAGPAFQWQYQMDRFGLTTAELKPYSNWYYPWIWERNTNGQIVREVLPPNGGGWRNEGEQALSGQEANLVYDSKGNLTSKTYSDGSSESYVYNTNFGVVSLSNDRFGNYVSYTLDDRGEALTANENGYRTTKYSYSPDPTPGASAAMAALPGGLVTQVIVAYASNDAAITNTEYWPAGSVAVGLVKTIEYPNYSTEQFTYDARRNPLTTVDQRGQTTDFIYDTLDRLVQTLEPLPGTGQHGRHRVQYRYDNMGNQRYVIDVTMGGGVDSQGHPTGRATENRYDAMDRLQFVIQAAPGGDTDLTAQNLSQTEFQYDAHSNLVREIDPRGAITQHFFDDRDREYETLSPAPNVALKPGVSADVLAPPKVDRLFDEYDHLVFTENELDQIETYRFDPLGRETREDGSATADHEGPYTLTSFDSQGNVSAARVAGPDGDRTTNYTYNAISQVRTEVSPPDVDGYRHTISHNYDLRGNETGVQDARGYTTTTVYNTMDWVTDVITPPVGDGFGSVQTHNDYNAAGDLLSKLVYNQSTYNPNNAATFQQTVYTPDNLGRTVKVVAPDPDQGGPLPAPETDAVFDAAGEQTASIDVIHDGSTTTNRETDYLFDNRGRNWKTVQPAVTLVDPQLGSGFTGNPQTIQGFDANGNVIATKVANANWNSTGYSWIVTNFVFDNLNRLYSTIAPALYADARPTTFNFYDAAGNVRYTVDPRGFVSQNIYDPYSELKKSISPATTQHASLTDTLYYDVAGENVADVDNEDRLTKHFFDKLGREIRTDLPAVDAGVPAIQTFYDPADNVIKTIDQQNNTTRTDFNPLNEPTKEYHPAPNGGSGEVYTQSKYDGFANLAFSVDELSKATAYIHDLLNRVVEVDPPTGDNELIHFDAAGDEVDDIDVQNNSVHDTYDAEHRVLTTTDQNGQTTSLGLDLLGQQTAVRDPDGNTTRFQFDQLGHVITETGFGTRDYGYDLSGNQTSIVLANGQVRGLEYDALNQVIGEKFYANIGASLADTPYDNIAYAYDDAGRLEDANSSAVQYHYTYDTNDRAYNETRSGAGGTINLYTRYPNRKDGLRESLHVTFADGKNTHYAFGYDADQQLTSIAQTSDNLTGTTNKYVTFGYGSDERLETVKRYADYEANSSHLVVTSTYGYKTNGQLESLTHVHGSTTLASFGFTYDTLDRIHAKTVTNATGSTTVTNTATYGYDDRSQLETVTNSSESVTNESYNYDDNGNRTDNGNVPGSHNRQAEDAKYTYQYDPEGNRTYRYEKVSGDYDKYTWDARNRLTKVEHFTSSDTLVWTVAYSYDHLNRMVVRAYTPVTGTAVSNSFVYDGDQVIAMLDGSGNVVDRYLWGPLVDQLLADEQASGDLWALGDNLNSVTDLVQYNASTGAVTSAAHRVFNSFGALTGETESADSTAPATASTVFDWTGRYLDPITGLQNNDNRWYDNWLHSWISKDPIGFGAGDANTSRYTENDPVNKVDPSGLHFTKEQRLEQLTQVKTPEERAIEEMGVWEPGENNWQLNMDLRRARMLGVADPWEGQKARPNMPLILAMRQNLMEVENGEYRFNRAFAIAQAKLEEINGQPDPNVPRAMGATAADWERWQAHAAEIRFLYNYYMSEGQEHLARKVLDPEADLRVLLVHARIARADATAQMVPKIGIMLASGVAGAAQLGRAGSISGAGFRGTFQPWAPDPVEVPRPQPWLLNPALNPGPRTLVAQPAKNASVPSNGNPWDGFHLPADDKGTWSDVRGNSYWTPNVPQDYGLKAGESVRFVNGYIDLNPYVWNNQRFKVPGLTGVHANDMVLISKHIARDHGWIYEKGRHAGKEQISRVEEWLTKNNVTPHHDPITGDVILVKSGKGNPHHIPHTGDAYRMRNE
jgi:RHS repeat-associated protein